MRVLFIGGTGVISSACTRLAVERGISLTLLNRGSTTRRPPPESVEILHADMRDVTDVEAALGERTFDVVVDWIAFTPEHIEIDLQLFTDRVGQYIFISSASAYHKPVPHLPITESTPLHNPYWQYSRDKIACELRLEQAHRETGFPVTIVRPSHTYDRTLLPFHGGYTVIDRMRRGKPILIHGDGTSLWVLTHHRDFAKGFIGLLGNPHALGETVHITSDELLTWNQIARILGQAAEVEPTLVHVASERIAAYDERWGASLLGDKSHSVIFDNTKIKRLVPGYRATIPFHEGARELVAWFDADLSRRSVDDDLDRLMDTIIEENRLSRDS
ncbi:MAG: SDR family oxidoreductase [Anaerolineae bacterium]